MQTLCIRSTQSTSTVASQHEYTKPTNAISIKRVTWSGRSLVPIDFMDDDIVTGYSAATTQSGDPVYYYDWGTSLFLRPTPSSVQTLKVWFYAKPTEVSTNTTLEIPEEYQMSLVDYILQHMFGKDGKDQMSAYHLAKWDASVTRIRAWERRRLRNSYPAAVKNMDAWSETTDLI